MKHRYFIKFLEHGKVVKEEIIDCLNPVSVAQYMGSLWCGGGKYRGYSYGPIRTNIL